VIQLIAVFCGQVALYSGFFSQICQLLFTEKLLTGPAVLEWLRKTKKSFTVESKVDPKGDGSEEVNSEDDEEDEIPIIEKGLLEKFVAEVSFE
jgi:hypothetical protein